MATKSKFTVKHGLAVNTQSGTTALLNYPTADGTNNQFIKTDGSGNLSFDSSVSSFINLTDTPANFDSAASRFLRVDSTGTAVEFSDVTVTNNVSRESFTASGDSNVITLANTYVGDNYVLVFIDGVIQFPGTNFSLDSTVLTFTATPDSAARIEVFGTSGNLITVPGDTTVSAAKLTNPLALQDNHKITFGTGSDLQIYHESNVSYLKAGTTKPIRILGPASGYMANFQPAGAVDLYYSSSKKFETTNTGVNVTGNTTATGNLVAGGNLEVDGNTLSKGHITVEDSAYITGSLVAGGNITSNGNMVSKGTITSSGHILPSADSTYDLGSASKKWRSLYVGGSTIYLGDKVLRVDSDGIVIPSGSRIGNRRFRGAQTDFDSNLAGTYGATSAGGANTTGKLLEFRIDSGGLIDSIGVGDSAVSQVNGLTILKGKGTFANAGFDAHLRIGATGKNFILAGSSIRAECRAEYRQGLGMAHADLVLGGSPVGGHIRAITDLHIDPSYKLKFEGSSADSWETTLTVVNPTADRTITFPDSTGTVLLADSIGHVGIGPNLAGTISPIDQFEVRGDSASYVAKIGGPEVYARFYADGATNTVAVHADGDTPGSKNHIHSLGIGGYDKIKISGTTTTAHVWIANGLNVGDLSNTAADNEIRATGNITAYFGSDKRLKENIKPLENAIDKIKSIRGVEFDWTDEDIERRGGEDGYFVQKHDVGVIAQEIEEVLPEVVRDRDDGFKAVQYEKIVPLLIQAIKEQQNQIDELKDKLNGLTG